MRVLPSFVALYALAGLIVPLAAQESEFQARREIEAVHAQWVETLNKGDVDAFARTYTPETVQIDAFGRTTGVNAEFLQVLQKKGIVLSMPIEGIRLLRGGQTGLAYGTYTSKYADPSMTPGEGNWVQTFERHGDSWKIVAHASSRSALATQMK